MTTTEFKTLMTRHLLGIADEDEESRLQEMLKADSEKNNIASEFCKLKDFSSKFEDYKKVDSKIAFDKFSQIVNQETFVDKKLVSTSRWWNRATTRVAAALIPLFILTALAYYLYTRSSEAPALAQADAPYTSVPPSRENPLLQSEEEDNLFSGFDKKEEPKTEYHTVSTPRATYRTLALEDGTRIHLDACSSITYPEHFSGNTRDVVLKGEAYFEIAKDAKKAFIVHVADAEVKQYGTQFNINAYNEKDVRVTLVQGSISVRNQGKAEKMIKPDQTAHITPQNVTISNDDVMLATEWMHGTHHFEGNSVQQLNTLLQRMYTQNTNLTDNGSSFSGVINQEDDFMDIVDAINCVADPMPIESDREVTDAQHRRVTLNLKGVNVRTFLDILHKRTGINYVFNSNDIKLLNNIYIKADHEPVETVVKRVFTNSKFQYRFRGNILTIKYNKYAQTTPPVIPAKKI